VDGRFVTPVDEPAGAAPLDDSRAAGAGAVAAAVEAMARAGLGPEQVAVWLGADPRSRLGARLSARRGCPTFVAGQGPGSPSDAGVTLLPAGGPAAWRDAVSAAAPVGPELRPRRLFVAGDDAEAAAVALALAEPGATLVFLTAPRGVVLPVAELALCRVLIGSGGYHPDLIPEAFAALRGDPDLLDGLIVTSSDRIPGRLALIPLS
jgi:hypothetical protein